jgi:hypothetical protein
MKETLVQFAQGIEDASKALEGTTAMASPERVAGMHGTNYAKAYGCLAED